MTFEVTKATRDNAPNLARVFFAAFSDDFNRTMFPLKPDVHVWTMDHLLGGKGAHDKSFLKITDPTDPDVVVAFAKWTRRAEGDRDRQESGGSGWPVSSDAELCERFFGRMEEDHHLLMGDRPHYYLEILGVHPSFQGRGLASQLLEWGLSRADQEGVEVYLSSSPAGRRLYERHGFREIGSFSPFPGYEQVNMIRPVQR